MRFLEPTPLPASLGGSSYQLASVRSRLQSAQRVLVLTGAGISVSAGLPTFRGTGGLYSGPGGIPTFMHADTLPDTNTQLWQFWGPLRDTVRAAAPTAAHHALAQWQARRTDGGAEVTLVTANVDDLHDRAGDGPVHHLHGSLFTSTCLTDGCAGRVDDDLHSDGTPTPCPVCGDPTRLGMVLFGEAVDLDALWAAKRAVRTCDAFVAVGTSGGAYPASGLVRYATDVGAYTVAVNPDPEAGVGFDQHLRLAADEALPAVLGQA
jgi:NAD-dependent deacetylase